MPGVILVSTASSEEIYKKELIFSKLFVFTDYHI